MSPLSLQLYKNLRLSLTYSVILDSPVVSWLVGLLPDGITCNEATNVFIILVFHIRTHSEFFFSCLDFMTYAMNAEEIILIGYFPGVSWCILK